MSDARRISLDVPNISSFLAPSVLIGNGVSLPLKLALLTCEEFQLCGPQKACEFVLVRRHGDSAR
jgi:hypothetical protein